VANTAAITRHNGPGQQGSGSSS